MFSLSSRISAREGPCENSFAVTEQSLRLVCGVSWCLLQGSVRSYTQDYHLLLLAWSAAFEDAAHATTIVSETLALDELLLAVEAACINRGMRTTREVGR